MVAPSNTWKKIEAKVAAVFGMKRRGADFGDRSGGKSDATNLDGSESERFSLEVKHTKRPEWKKMVDACHQAEKAALEGQEPIVVMHKHGDSIEDCLVVQRLSVFREWRLGDVEAGN